MSTSEIYGLKCDMDYEKNGGAWYYIEYEEKECGVFLNLKGWIKMTAEKYELIIIGTGTVSNDGMQEAIAHGVKKILVVEKDKLGGTCLNYG
jgi:hypothetical protein